MVYLDVHMDKPQIKTTGSSISRVIRIRIVLAIVFAEAVILLISVTFKYQEVAGQPDMWSLLSTHTLRMTVMFAIIVAFVIMAVERFLGPLIVIPIKKIAEANRLLSQGDSEKGRHVDFKYPVPEEIASIVESRDGMLTQLEELHEEVTRQKEKLTSELLLCGEMQKQFLPASMPLNERVRIAMLYEPFSYAGGDMYEFISLNGKLGVMVGDVSGHGVDSSLAAALMNIPFKNIASSGVSPETVLFMTNLQIHPALDTTGIFITSIYGVFDFNKRTLTFSTAGHPPLILVRDGTAQKLETDGSLPLGLFGDAVYSLMEIDIKSGDRFYFYTDGIYEALDNNEKPFGLANWVALCEKVGNTSLKESIGEIFTCLKDYTGGTKHDDLTVIAVEIA